MPKRQAKHEAIVSRLRRERDAAIRERDAALCGKDAVIHDNMRLIAQKTPFYGEGKWVATAEGNMMLVENIVDVVNMEITASQQKKRRIYQY